MASVPPPALSASPAQIVQGRRSLTGHPYALPKEQGDNYICHLERYLDEPLPTKDTR